MKESEAGLREVKKDLSESDRLAEAATRAAACVAMDEGNLAAATAPVRGSVLRAGPSGLILDAMAVCVCGCEVSEVRFPGAILSREARGVGRVDLR